MKRQIHSYDACVSLGLTKFFGNCWLKRAGGNLVWYLSGRGLKVFNCLFARRNGEAESWLQVDLINPGITHVNKQQFWEFLNIYPVSQLHFSLLP